MKSENFVPRLASYLIHVARGGYVDVHNRDVRIAPRRVDTVPKHAVKASGEFIGRNGVVLPINNGRK